MIRWFRISVKPKAAKDAETARSALAEARSIAAAEMEKMRQCLAEKQEGKNATD